MYYRVSTERPSCVRHPHGMAHGSVRGLKVAWLHVPWRRLQVHDFDQKVTSKLASLIETWGVNEAFVVLDQVR